MHAESLPASPAADRAVGGARPAARGAFIGLFVAGGALVSAMAAIAMLPLQTGEPRFVLAMTGAILAYLTGLWIVHRHAGLPGPVIAGCIALGVLARVVLLGAPPGVARDAIRYAWDARVQRAGLSPYEVRPDDPAVAHLHTDLTRDVDAGWLPTIYPPAAQVYFRLVTGLHESLVAFRVAAALCDTLVTFVLIRVLAAAGRPRGWALVVAWHPILAFESAAGAHVDSAGALALVMTQWALLASRTGWAAVLYATAVLVKPLPVVLLPIVVPRLRARDLALAAAWAGALGLVVTRGGASIGSIGAFIDGFRFNGPVFAALVTAFPPRTLAVAAVAAGLAVAALYRRRPASDAAAWSWPMAVALTLGPVVYPWYLAWVVPFVRSASTLPIGVWSLSILAISPVWHANAQGAPFEVPAAPLAIEFGLPVAASAFVAVERLRRRRQ